MIYRALPSDGLDVAWVGPLGDTTAEFRWENEGWTVNCMLGPQRAQVVMRVGAQWHVQQVIVFRDMDEPDLWLATDGAGRWGEVNGAHRTDLDGCRLVAVVGSPIAHCIAIRQLPLHVGHGAEVKTAVIDTETLSVVPRTLLFERLDDRLWRYATLETPDAPIEVRVDEYGLVVAEEGGYERR
jgi:hypothetical protein